MFCEGMEVAYKDLRGVIDFIDEQYLVIKIPPPPKGGNSPRVIVYKSDQKKITLLNNPKEDKTQ